MLIELLAVDKDQDERQFTAAGDQVGGRGPVRRGRGASLLYYKRISYKENGDIHARGRNQQLEDHY